MVKAPAGCQPAQAFARSVAVVRRFTPLPGAGTATGQWTINPTALPATRSLVLTPPPSGNSGTGNSGTGNSGTGNSGTGNSGTGNSGTGNSANSGSSGGSQIWTSACSVRFMPAGAVARQQSDTGNSGTGNSGTGNSGTGNSGTGNSGTGG